MSLSITDIEVSELRIPGLDDLAHAGSNWTCLVRVETSAGIEGIAEVTSVPSVIRAIVEASTMRARGLKGILMSSDPTDVEGLARRMYELSYWHGRRGAVIHAIGAIEMALWDLKGKLEGRPIAALLGTPRRDRACVYATLYPTERDPDDLRRQLDGPLTAGFVGFKICADSSWATDLDRVAKLIAAARRHVGRDHLLIIEVAWAFSRAEEILPLMPLLRDHEVAWLEAPLLLDDLDGHASLQGHGVPIAAGDNALTTRHEFQTLLDVGKVDIVQPDIAIAGGFSETLAVAALARARGKRVVVHGYKTALTDAANPHFASQHWTDEPVEFAVSDSPLRQALTRERFEVGPDGRIPVPAGPGLGVTLDQERVDALRVS